MKEKFRISLLVVVVGLLLTSCSKYDDGPSFSLYSKGKRVAGTWYFTRVLYNDADSSEAYLDNSIRFYLGDEGSDKEKGYFTWTTGYDQASQQKQISFGGWRFVADMDSMQMIVIGEDVGDFDTIQWKINRLAYDQWWMERHTNDTTLLLWQLWKVIY